MLIIACALLAIATVPLTGGRLARLAHLRLRGVWLLVLALGAQIVVIEVPGLPTAPSAAVHVATYGLAAAFVAVNRRVTGLWLLALGAACNGAVIALNGGTLPSSEAARRTAGVVVDAGFLNSGPVADPVLGWLGDVFAVPQGVPLANVFSVGDVLVVAGAAWVVHAASRRRAAHRAPRPRARARGLATGPTGPLPTGG